MLVKFNIQDNMKFGCNINNDMQFKTAVGYVKGSDKDTVKSETVKIIKTVTKSEYRELEESGNIDASTLYIVVQDEQTEG